MRPDQTIYEMVEEVLMRQAGALLQSGSSSPQEALDAVLQTEAGRQLREMRDGPHAHEKARDWQESLLWQRAFERLEHMARSEAGARVSVECGYSWVEGYIEWLRGKEARAEYHALLEAELTSLRG